MVRQQRQFVLFASPDEFLREDEISREAEVVRPNDHIVRCRRDEELIQSALDLLAQFRRRLSLFGEIAKGGFDEQLDRRSRAGSHKNLVPFSVGPFAAGQDDGGDLAAECVDEVRRGQLHNPPDATGSQMIMDDNQLQRRSLFNALQARSNAESAFLVKWQAQAGKLSGN